MRILKRGACALAAAALLATPAAQEPGGAGSLESFEAAWQLVADTHPDRTFGGVDWRQVREELRPRAAAAGSPAELRRIIQEMLARLQQSHFAVLPAPAPAGDADGDVGLEIRFAGPRALVFRVEPAGPAARAGVRPGWLLDTVSNRPIGADLGASVDLPERLRTVEQWRAVIGRLRGPIGSTVDAGFLDGAGRRVVRRLERRADTGEPVRVGHLPPMPTRVWHDRLRSPAGRAIGVIGFNAWMTPVDPLFGAAVDALRHTEGLVLDLRGNPGGLAAMLMGIAGHFFDERISLGTMVTRETRLEFFANPRRVNGRGEPVAPFAGPVAILIDGLTGSASECFAGGMQAVGRARVFGEASMGQALPALFHVLPNGDVLLHAHADFTTPGGGRLEGRGVRPDEVVPLRQADLLAGRDAPLEAAIRWIDGRR
jgi:carboxyl-terminal processing protease